MYKKLFCCIIGLEIALSSTERGVDMILAYPIVSVVLAIIVGAVLIFLVFLGFFLVYRSFISEPEILLSPCFEKREYADPRLSGYFLNGKRLSLYWVPFVRSDLRHLRIKHRRKMLAIEEFYDENGHHIPQTIDFVIKVNKYLKIKTDIEKRTEGRPEREDSLFFKRAPYHYVSRRHSLT